MKRFRYICADAGIRIPGGKGASIHVESVCRAFAEAGLTGEIFAMRADAPSLCGLPVRAMRLPDDDRTSDERRETGLFLAGLDPKGIGEGRCDFIYERYSLWHVGGLAHARKLGVPFILEVNSPLPDEARRFRNLANPALAERVARLLLHEADGIVCVSEEVADWVRRYRASGDGVWVVPNGVDHRRFASGDGARRAGLVASPAPLIAFSGSFRPWHGVYDLLDALRLLIEDHAEDAHLLCIGDGPLREPFERRAGDLGIRDRVHLTGHVPHDEVAGWLRGCDVAVAPYPELDRFYFSPLKIFEFMALGLPVVAADVGQVCRLVPHGERGWLYRAGSPEELAGAIGRLLGRREDARRLGQAGRKWVLANATWTKRVETILQRIRGLTPARRPARPSRRSSSRQPVNRRGSFVARKAE